MSLMMQYIASNANILRLILLLMWAQRATALTGSYCKSTTTSSNDDVNFCLDVDTSFNDSTLSGDLHISIKNDRYKDSTLGWIGVGPGSLMDGSLMFVIYGDPDSATPTVSIRTASGHQQPNILTSGTELPEIKINSSWSSGAKGFTTSTVDIDCFGCTSWSGTEISVENTQMSFIWAYNSVQDFQGVYSSNVPLQPHPFLQTGFGTIHVDMEVTDPGDHKASTATPVSIGGKEGQATAQKRYLWGLHGVLMATAATLVFPMGFVAQRSGLPIAFKLHWSLQCVGCSMMLVGGTIGVLLSKRFFTAHQYLGLIMVVLLFVQILWGYRHHVTFIKTMKKSWLSTAHVSLGRGLLCAGFLNVPLGLQLGGYRTWVIFLATTIELLQLLVLGYAWWTWQSGKITIGNLKWYKNMTGEEIDANMNDSFGESSFALTQEEDDMDNHVKEEFGEEIQEPLRG